MMASTMTHAHDFRSLAGKTDKLSIQGTGITPRVSTPTNDLQMPSGVDPVLSQSYSDDDNLESVVDNEENTMLNSVVHVNKILEGQIEALRLRLQVEEKQHRDDKGKLKNEKDKIIAAKETEIEDLKDSLVSREERIQMLVRASEEKDRTIKSKVGEIENLKQLVKQTEEYADKLHRQIGRVREDKKGLEADTLYREQNLEIKRLTEELELLKKKLGEIEIELQRAIKIIEAQNSKLRDFETGNSALQDKFREDLDKATKSMRQEVERMREVMRQNYEEMRNLREQNRQMHNDVKDIKEILLKSKLTPRNEQGTGVQRPLTASPVHMFKAAEFSNRGPVLSRGQAVPKTPSQGVRRPGGASKDTRQSIPHMNAAAISKDRTPLRTQIVQKSQVKTSMPSVQADKQRNLPPICSLKDEPAPSNPAGPSQGGKTGLNLATAKNTRK